MISSIGSSFISFCLGLAVVGGALSSDSFFICSETFPSLSTSAAEGIEKGWLLLDNRDREESEAKGDNRGVNGSVIAWLG